MKNKGYTTIEIIVYRTNPFCLHFPLNLRKIASNSGNTLFISLHAIARIVEILAN